MASRLQSVTRPRGHLPARVYWFRRALVLVPALLLALGLAHLVGGGSNSPGERARLTGAQALTASAPSPTPSPTPGVLGPMTVPTFGPGTTKTPARTQGTSRPTQSATQATTGGANVPLASPDGPCAADEISVLPMVRDARAGAPVTIRVQLTATRPACTFAVSRKSLAVKITSGSDPVWSSQPCVGSIPERTVVVRSAQPAVVPVMWSGRRSDATCGPSHPWARPGTYHVHAAVIGSEPSDSRFTLSLPPRPVVTETAHPKPSQASSQGPAGKGSSCGGDNAAGSC